MLTLPSGQYLGGVIHRTRLHGSVLTLSVYPGGHTYAPHVHEAPTLFLLLAGQHRDESRFFTFHQSPLSAVFHPTDVPHATHIGPGGMIGLNLELTDVFLKRCQIGHADLSIGHRLLDSWDAQLLVLRLAALTGSCNGGPSPDAADAETGAIELVACLLRHRAPPGHAPPWLPRAEEFLRSAACRPVSLIDVAAEVGVHPVYCARAFRRFTGCTVSAYVHALRLIEAGRLVLDGRCSLAEAALRAGFADQAHFTRLCTRRLGFTPGRLQRLRRGFPTPDQPGSNRSRSRAGPSGTLQLN